MVFDTIVVGAGIEGSATAYHLAKTNKNTLLLEQFLLPHTRGSSHGQSRIIRKAYVQQHYADMMNEAYEMWHTLEEETHTKLFQKTGLLVVARPPCTDYVDRVEKALAGSRAVYQRLTAEQINKQFPMMKFNAGDVGVFEKEAGVLFADKALQAYHKMFLKYGGTLHDGEPVTKIIPGEIVTVETSKGKYQARSVVIAAGPWTNKVVKPLGLNLPLKTKLAKVCFWQQKSDDYCVENGFPCIMFDGFYKAGEYHHMYGIPALEYPLHVKLCADSVLDIDPDMRDVNVDRSDEQTLSSFVGNTLPGIKPTPSIIEKCITTKTPDTDFIMDRHPCYTNIVIGAAFSGHGFKMAPVIGRILSQLAGKIPTSDNLEHFSLKRFNSTAYQSKI